MTTASKITIVRVMLMPVLMLFLYLGNGQQGTYMYIAAALFMLGSLTDYLDGYIARKYHQVSDFGKFLDPLADKLLTIAVMTMFCEWQRFPAWALMVILTREFSVTGLRLIAVGKGNVIAAGWSGKIKTASTMVGLTAWMCLPGSELLGDIVIVVIVATTLYSGLEYFAKNWRELF